MGILSSIVVLKDPFWVFVDGIITYPKTLVLGNNF